MKSPYIPHIVGVGLLTFGLSFSSLTLPATAQNNSAPATNTTPRQNVNSAPLDLNHTNLKNDQGPMRAGWLGWFGLIGLVGLAGRKRQQPTSHSEGDRIASSRTRP